MEELTGLVRRLNEYWCFYGDIPDASVSIEGYRTVLGQQGLHRERSAQRKGLAVLVNDQREKRGLKFTIK